MLQMLYALQPRDWERSATREGKATTIRRKMISGLVHVILIYKTVKVDAVCHIFCMTFLGLNVYIFLFGSGAVIFYLRVLSDCQDTSEYTGSWKYLHWPA